MFKKKVFVSTSSFAQLDHSPLQMLYDAGFDVLLNPYKRKLSKSEAIEHYSSCDGLIAGLETLDAEVLSKSTLKVISRCGVGLSNVDLDAAKIQNIKIYSTPDAPTIAVAELTIAAMLSLLRHVSEMNQDLHRGVWQKVLGQQLSGKTVVLIGFGRIGRKVAQLLCAFEARVIAVDPLARSMDGVEIMPLIDALKLADIISLHVSGEYEVLGQKELQYLKRGVMLLNVARGAVWSEEALVEGLNKGVISGVWCDVFTQEPYQGELIHFPQVLLTPHVGSYTKECRSQMEREAVENLIEGFRV